MCVFAGGGGGGEGEHTNMGDMWGEEEANVEALINGRLGGARNDTQRILSAVKFNILDFVPSSIEASCE